VAIIMDGNGRWATHRGLPRVAGHHEGVKSARSIVRASSALGLRYLTLYAFSTENWSRPPDEVSMLMSLLERSVNAELPELMALNARLRVLGRTNGLPSGVRRGIDHVVHETRNNTGLTVLMAFNYGVVDELIDAFRSLARQIVAGSQARGHLGKRRSARRSTPPTSPIPISGSARAARCGSRTFSCGRSPTRSSG
jgi:undecaprenyl diphosphate synthase